MKKRGMIITGIVLLLALISFYFDSKIIEHISLLRNDYLNDFFLGITFVSSEIIIFFFLTSLFLWKEHKRKWILPLWATLGLSAIVSFFLKIMVQRPRPFQLGITSILPILEKSSHVIWNFSFPSFQAMLAFCAIPIISKEFPRLKNIWIVFALIVAFSRVYFGLHFMSDVIIGGVIGYMIGMFVVNTERKNKFWEKMYSKIFGKSKSP